MTNFGKKDSSSWDYGNKAMGVFTKGVKLAGDVESVAGDVSTYAGLGATGAAMIGAEPIAAGLLGVAGLAKSVQLGAGEAKSIGKRIER